MKPNPEIRWWKRNWRCKFGTHDWHYGYLDGTDFFFRQCGDCGLKEEFYYNGRPVNERLLLTEGESLK